MKSPDSGTTCHVALPGSGLLLSVRTASTLSQPGRIAALTSTRKREKAPSWRPSLTPFSQTSATMLAASNSRKLRLPAAGAQRVRRYQPMPRSALIVASRAVPGLPSRFHVRSEEHTSELQSLMRISYAAFCLKKKKKDHSHCWSRRHQEH